MKVKLEFLKDFATKEKGDKGEYDSMLARTLINKKVAKKVIKKTKKED